MSEPYSPSLGHSGVISPRDRSSESSARLSNRNRESIGTYGKQATSRAQVNFARAISSFLMHAMRVSKGANTPSM
jgi:hypothetical protein